MEFRRRHNCYYATLTAVGSRDPVGVLTSSEIEVDVWLGIADRVIARQIPGAKSVLLDIEGWQPGLLDPCQWLPAGTYMVGARLPEGVIGIMDGKKPMLRRLRGDVDRLGRVGTQEAVEPTPWFMRSL